MTFTNFIIGFVLLLLVIVVLSQLTKVGDLLTNLKGTQDESEQKNSGLYATIFVIVGIVGIGLLVWSYFSAEGRFLPEAASELGRDWNKYFWIYSIPIVAIFFITHALLFFFSYRYRYKINRKVFYFPESNKLELIWTSIPLVVVLALGVSTLGKWMKATGKPSENALHIKITGQQFKWFIAYPGDDQQFGQRDIIQYGEMQNLLGLNPNDSSGYDDVYTDEIVVPVNREIAFDLSALDVLHDFYLPHFRMKMDAIPGVPTSIKITPDKTTAEMKEQTGNEDFEYEIACAELCGSGHWNMRTTLRVVSEEEYESWLSEQTLAKEVYYNTLLAEDSESEENTEQAQPEEEQDAGSSEEESSGEHGETASL